MPYTMYPYEAAPLPYGYDALEPSVDAETMHYHHDKHYQTYVDNLNKALEKHPELQTIPLARILTNPHLLPVESRVAILRNGGGVFNHYHFFNILGPYKEDNCPGEKFESLLADNFGSFESFKKQFTQSATGVFGSGYAVLARTPKNKLVIETCANQDTVLPNGEIPLLLFDVWEHAYYLKYKNLRASYLENIWNVVNYDNIKDFL